MGRGGRRSQVSGHIFVDETKHRGYLIVASVIPPGELDASRKLVRGLVLPGQRRLHMKAESDPRRRTITAAVVDTGIQATVYDAPTRYPTQLHGRAACLRAVVDDAAGRGDSLLVLEQDDTLLAWDNQRLSSSPAPPAAETPCATSTAAPPPSSCWRSRRHRLVLGQGG